MDKTIYGGIGAVVAAAVMFLASLTGIGGGDSPPADQAPGIEDMAVCPVANGWLDAHEVSEHGIVLACERVINDVPWRVILHPNGMFNHAIIDPVNNPDGEFITDPTQVPDWPLTQSFLRYQQWRSTILHEQAHGAY